MVDVDSALTNVCADVSEDVPTLTVIVVAVTAVIGIDLPAKGSVPGRGYVSGYCLEHK